MNNVRLDPAVRDWISEGPFNGPDPARRRVLAALRQVEQRPRWMFPRAWPGLAEIELPLRPLAGFAALLVVLTLLAALALTATFIGSARPRSVALPDTDQLMAFADGTSVVAQRLDGSGRRNLSGDLPYARAPLFSADGSRVAFLAPASAAALTGRLMVGPVDGSSAPIDISGGREVLEGDIASVSWAPDGNRLAFAAVEQGVATIFVAWADGSGLTEITDHSADRDLPSWSPDGQWIAYRVTRRDGIHRELEMTRPDGTGTRSVTQVIASDGRLSRLRWSPRADYEVAYWLNAGFGSTDTALIDLGSDHTNALWTTGLGGSAETGVAWSPDGSWLAMITATDGVVLAADDRTTPYDGQIRRLGQVADCWVDWSPDGSALYGGSPDGCKSTVVVPLNDPSSATMLPGSGMASWQPAAR